MKSKIKRYGHIGTSPLLLLSPSFSFPSSKTRNRNRTYSNDNFILLSEQAQFGTTLQAISNQKQEKVQFGRMVRCALHLPLKCTTIHSFIYPRSMGKVLRLWRAIAPGRCEGIFSQETSEVVIPFWTPLKNTDICRYVSPPLLLSPSFSFPFLLSFGCLTTYKPETKTEHTVMIISFY